MVKSCTIFSIFTITILSGTHLQAQAPAYRDSVAAIVRDKVITVFDLHREARAAEQELRKNYTADELEKKIVELRKNIAEQMIAQELIYAEFETLGGRIPKELIQKRIDHIILSETGGNRVAFEERLHKQEMTMADIEERVRKAIAVEMMLQEEVFRKVQVSPVEIENYYQENVEKFAQKTKVKLKIIRLNANEKDTMQKIQEKLQQGESFGVLAKMHSADDSAVKNGDLGWVEIDNLNVTFKDAVQSLQDGQTSDLVSLGENIYLLHVEKREEGGTIELNQDLRKKILNQLENQEKSRRYEEYVAKLQQKFYVKKLF